MFIFRRNLFIFVMVLVKIKLVAAPALCIQNQEAASGTPPGV